MVEAAPEDSVTSPGVVGMGKLAFMVSVGTGMGWVEGHRLVPSLWRTLRAMWDLWSSALSSCWPPVARFLATQSGKTMRKPSTPLPHCVGGVAEPAFPSSLPQYQLMRESLMTLRSAWKG